MNRRNFFSAVWNERARPAFAWAAILLLGVLLINFDLSNFGSFSVNWGGVVGLVLLFLPIIGIIFFLALVSYLVQEFIPASYKRIVRIFLRAVSVPAQLAIMSWAYYTFYQKRDYVMIVLITVLLAIHLFKEYRKKKPTSERSNTPV